MGVEDVMKIFRKTVIFEWPIAKVARVMARLAFTFFKVVSRFAFNAMFSKLS